MGARPTTDENRLARFLAKVQQEGECLLWRGAKDKDGYGWFIWSYRDQRYAHRVAHELFIGPIPAKIQVLHSCDKPGCVNPDHLFLGTNLDNMRDKVAKGRESHQGRSRQTHCKRGHEFTTENTYLHERKSGGILRQCKTCFRLRG